MTLAQLLRLLRRIGTPVPPPPAPSMLTRPTISSPRQVGVLATVTPGTYANATSVVGYVWKVDGVQVGVGTSYLPTEGQETATTFTVEETVSGLGGALTTPSLNAAPILEAEVPPDLGDAYAGVAPETMVLRNAIVNEYEANAWPGVPQEVQDGGPWMTDVTVNNDVELEAAIAVIPRTPEACAAYHRIRLRKGGVYNACELKGANGTEMEVAYPEGIFETATKWYVPGGIWDTGWYFGSVRDYSSAGGGLFITSEDPEDRVRFDGIVTIRGARGLHIKHVQFANIATYEENYSRDAAQMIVITNSSTNRDGPVVRIEECDIGTAVNPAWDGEVLRYGVGIGHTSAAEQVDVINCRFNGCQTGIKGNGVRYSKMDGNDFQQILGDDMIWLRAASVRAINSAWDERIIWWTRMNTARRPVDHLKISHEHTDHVQAGTSGDTGNYSILHEFEAYYGLRQTYTDARYLTFTGTVGPPDGATITVAGQTFTFRDTPTLSTDIQRYSVNPATDSTITINGVVYTFRPSQTTPTQIVRSNNALTTTLNVAKVVIETALTPVPHLDRIITDVTSLKFHFMPHNIQTVTASVGSINTVRPAGGTQFLYHDDLTANYTMTCVNINCIGVTNDGIGGRLYNGDGVMDRCTFGRPGDQPEDAEVGIDGFSASQDFEVYGASSRIRRSTGLDPVHVDHTYRSCVLGHVTETRGTTTTPIINTYDVDDVYLSTNGVLTMANNRFVKWAADADPAKAPDVMLAGVGTEFEIDVQGRWRYDFADDGTDTQQQFRERLYNVLKLANVTDRANIGVVNPADWE